MIERMSVERKCYEFTRETNIEVTDQAQVLITQILNAVISDPHPTWQNRTHEYLEDQAYRYENEIPKILTTVVHNQQIEAREDKSITTFDILIQFYTICDVFCFELRKR